MGDGYEGLGREDRGGCLAGAGAGLVALFLDVG